MPERVGIFIDGPNLFSGARRLTGDGRVNAAALALRIASDREITEACFWTAVLDQAQNAATYARQRAFFAHFERQVPNGRIGRASLRRQPDGRQVEKGVDVGVALDLVMGAVEDRWDAGVTVSGDGDLARAGEIVRRLGKRFEVVACERALSGLLRIQANRVTILRAADLNTLRGSG